MVGEDLQRSRDEMLSFMRKKNNPAGYALERLQILISQFQSKLSSNSEIAINLAGTSSPSHFHLRAMSVSNPDILIFDGVDADGNAMRLLQHYTQMAVVLVEAPKIDAQPYRIGF